MQRPSASSSTDEGMQYYLICYFRKICVISGKKVEVPNALVEELAGLRFAFANLLYRYENELNHSPEAQKEFVKFLPRLFRRAVGDHSFQSHFNTLVEEEVSLFNIFYLKQLCTIFPEDTRYGYFFKYNTRCIGIPSSGPTWAWWPLHQTRTLCQCI